MKTLTASQAAATQPGHSIWVAASAGTGKTHVLTARVLRLMLSGTPPGRILCLTFTKAAANEMSTRIYKELGIWTGLGDKALSAAIYARTNEKADDGMLVLARNLFATVLDLPGGLKIQTIHSFCQSLLGRFPAEAGLSPRFQLMDERTAREILGDALERVLGQARKKGNEKLADALAHIAVTASEQTFTELMAAVTGERAHFRHLLEEKGGEEGLIRAIFEALGLPPGRGRDETLAEITSEKILDSEGLSALTKALAGGSAKEQEKAAAIGAFLEAPEGAGRIAAYGDYNLVFLTRDGGPRKTVANKGTLAAAPQLAEVIEVEMARLEAADIRLKLLEAAMNSAAFTRLAAAVVGGYEAAKRRQGKLDYDDLILTADRLLHIEGIAPWILYKLDGGIDHILLDEAQDTNPEQWRLLKALSHEFFVGKSAREMVRSLFAVGDAKQSIFGFQRADPVEFRQTAKWAEERAGAAGMTFRRLELNLSFRSTGAVLGTVDEIFKSEAARLGLDPGGGDIRHAVKRVGMSGRVELWPSEAAAPDPDPGEWAAPVIQEPVQSSEARLAAKMARHIKELISGKDMLKARDRPVRPADIMVLVRRRSAFVDHLVRELKSAGVPVAGSDRMELAEQIAVMDLMAAAEFVLLPGDDLNLASLLKSPFIGLTEEDLFDLAYERGRASLWETLAKRRNERAAFAEARAFLLILLREADRFAPFDFFSLLLNPLGGRRQLIARLGQDINDPVDEFLNLALDFERSHLVSLQGFLSWLGAGKAEIKRDLDQGRQEVRIMTVHGAKGLEAPVVYLPDTCGTPPDKQSLLRLPIPGGEGPELLIWPGGRSNEVKMLEAARLKLRLETEAEHKRLFYVALTRAEDRLYLAGFETKTGRRPGCWYDMAGEAFGSMPGVEKITDPVLGEVLRFETAQETAPVVEAALDKEKTAPPELPGWAVRNPAAEPSPPKPLYASAPSEEEPTVIGPGQRSRGYGAERGLLVHKLLEELPNIEAGQQERIARSFMARQAFGLSRDEVEAVWKSVERVLRDPVFASLFGPGSRAEVAISATFGERVLSGRIDRLLVRDDRILIVDFKSNRPPPRGLKDIPEVYLRQMAAYSAAVGRIYPELPVRAALLWTEEARLMELPATLLAPYIEAIGA